MNTVKCFVSIDKKRKDIFMIYTQEKYVSDSFQIRINMIAKTDFLLIMKQTEVNFIHNEKVKLSLRIVVTALLFYLEQDGLPFVS